MITRRSLCILLAILTLVPAPWQVAASPAHGPALPYNAVTAGYVQNIGQFPAAVRYQGRFGAHTLWVTDDGLYLTSLRRNSADTGWQAANVRLSFRDAIAPSRISGEGHVSARLSYLRRSDPSRWVTGAPVWSAVRLRDLYPGVDLALGSDHGRFTWQLQAHQGADLPRLALEVEGDQAQLTEGGGTTLATVAGDLQLPALGLATASASGQPLAAASPNASADELLFSGFLGGSAQDRALDLALDGAGNAYVAGLTVSTDFTTTVGALDSSFNFGNYDAFVAKLVPSTGALAYATYLGGNLDDQASAIAVDSSGCAVVGGYTGSPDFPATAGSYDPSYNNADDGFIVKLSADGTALLYGTFFGASSHERICDIALDGGGNVYATGWTKSQNLPVTAGAYDSSYNHGEGDGFVAKLASDGRSLLYATFLGSWGAERGEGIAVDEAGAAYVTGWTDSVAFPTSPGAYDGERNDSVDAFVVKLGSTGGTLAYGTFLGASTEQRGQALAVDRSGNAYVTGRVWAVKGSDSAGDWDAFATKLGPDGDTAAYSVSLGGSGDDWGNDIQVDGRGQAHVTGATSSADFPTTYGVFGASLNGGYDAFLAKLASYGTRSLYVTYLGGSADDETAALAVDAVGYVTLAGWTASADLPTSDQGWQALLAGGEDAFVAQLAAGIRATATPAPTRTPTATGTPTPTCTETPAATSTAPPAAIRLPLILR